MIKVGDKVKILRAFTDKEHEVGWNDSMRGDVGKIGTVESLGDYYQAAYVRADGETGCWYWPLNTLQLVAQKKQKPWNEIAQTLAKFQYSNGEKISWRKIAKMIGVPKSTTSDFLRKLRKQSVLG